MSRTSGERILGFAFLALLAACGAERFQPGGTGGSAPSTGSGGALGKPDVSQGTGGAGGVIDPGTGGAGAVDPIGGNGGEDTAPIIDTAPVIDSAPVIDGGPDSADSSDTPELPPGCVSSADCTCKVYGGHDYRFCKDRKNFAAARAACVTSGMKLVRLNDAAENQWAYDVTVAEGLTSIWIGATDSATEGDWRWVDGTPFWSGKGAAAGGLPAGGLYNAWDSLAAEPNQTGDEDCAGYWRARPTWSDLTCTDLNPYICEGY